ncbi:hypothetical protein [Actinokineospora iranica]|uniref:Uncharacterized protein n=1 Tax=Actinokineospora iranica TaxID=1271860 RepID=A0A1G6R0G7_9PSEU|nr:hypothetical protein [Actinokineospora iranica]SDC97933.1 hypothetical protein SAMN05216174_10666 [Actinokineospora iranica]
MTTRAAEYYMYFGRTFKLDTTPDGQWVGYLLNWDTGEFEIDNDPIMPISGATSSSDIWALDKEDFIWRTEEIRAYRLRGDGPIFALYDTIRAMFAQRESEGRKLFTDEELALIKSIRRRTFAMWEAETARRAAGEPPTFSVRHRWDVEQ